MKDMKQIAVRMCAGCNCTYDRRKVLQTLENAFAGECEFTYSYDVGDDVAYDAVLLINGCDSECAVPSEVRESIVIDHNNYEEAIEVFKGRIQI